MSNKKLKLDELGRMDAQTYVNADKIPLIVILDNIRSGHNVGAIFRTSDAYRVEEIILCGITAQPPQKDIQKSALGATETVRWSYVKNTQDAIEQLKEQDYRIACIEQCESSRSLADFSIKADEKWAVVLGNEVQGVQQEIVDMADVCIELPQFGTKHSLNVSVCGGIVIWEFQKAWFKDR